MRRHRDALDGAFVNAATAHFDRVLVFVAHPDDETIGCGALLQRATAGLVVFAVDGAPPHYGFEGRYGSLRKYSDLRFHEASRALQYIPHRSYRRLTKKDGTWFVDQHLFRELLVAFASLSAVVSEFSPDLVVSHAFEGGHIDHDACHNLAERIVSATNLRTLEFPLYWKGQRGEDVFQRFREGREGELALQLSDSEGRLKRRMLAEYRTQQNLMSVFHCESERFRPLRQNDYTRASWFGYAYENRQAQLKAELFLQKIAEFRGEEESAGPSLIA